MTNMRNKDADAAKRANDECERLRADNERLHALLADLQKENVELSAQVNELYRLVMRLQAKSKGIAYWSDVAARSKPLEIAQRMILMKHALTGTKEERGESLRWLRGDKSAVPKHQYLAQIVQMSEQLERDSRIRISHQLDEAQMQMRGCEYKYYRFREKRKARFQVDFSQFAVAHVKGLVSVVLPVFNGEDMVEESIRSILAQTYEQLELIIVDDGSTDRTPEIVDAWAERDRRIRVVHQENRKLPGALNRGFSLAGGEFLTWTSADNNMHPDFLEKLVGVMRRHARWAMCYANIRVIDGCGQPVVNEAWYPDTKKSADVLLPDAALRLNTYADNTVGAAFLYRAAIPMLIGGYREDFYTVEDYEYWMRINDYFSVKHAGFRDVIYDYRVHDGSLTAKAKELRIQEKREKLMRMEDFRQDWILRPKCWLMGDEARPQWQSLVDAAGDFAMTQEEARQIAWPRLGSGVIQLSVGKGGALIEPDEPVAEDAVRVLVRYGETRPEDRDRFDYRIQIGDLESDVAQGWIRAIDERSAFSLIQILCSAHGFEAVARASGRQTKPSRKATVVLCTYRRVESAKRALRAMMEQTLPQEKYEILVVNNDPGCDEMRRAVYEKQRACGDERRIRYVDCPYPGLSMARNFAIYEAEGEIVMFVDDDGLMQPDCLERIVDAFDEHPMAGVIGGQIVLKIPEDARHVVLRGHEGIWSDRRYDKDQYFETENASEYPYGCNYAIRGALLREMGGFRASYGRMGKDYSGGEEMVLSHLAAKAGMKIGIEPRAVVLHDVEASRFTLDHVRQTLRAGRLTNRQMKMDFYKEFDPWMKEEYLLLEAAQDKLDGLIREGKNEDDLSVFYCRSDLDATREAIQAGHGDLAAMRKGFSYRI